MEDAVDNLHEIPADKLAEIYIKIRDKRAELAEEFEKQDAVLKEQQEVLAEEMLEVCNDNNAYII
jgi:hypothetical protein